MKLPALLLASIAVFALSACGSRDNGEDGTNISINAKDKDGAVAIDADGKTGQVKVQIPGFDANLKLPKMMLDHSNFDLDGVKLFPGSKVRSVVVNADKGDKAKVRVSFDSPGDPAKVRDWFKNGLVEHEMEFAETPAGFSGKTGDGDPFVITLSPATGAATSGTIDIES